MTLPFILTPFVNPRRTFSLSRRVFLTHCYYFIFHCFLFVVHSNFVEKNEKTHCNCRYAAWCLKPLRAIFSMSLVNLCCAKILHVSLTICCPRCCLMFIIFIHFFLKWFTYFFVSMKHDEKSILIVFLFSTSTITLEKLNGENWKISSHL